MCLVIYIDMENIIKNVMGFEVLFVKFLLLFDGVKSGYDLFVYGLENG